MSSNHTSRTVATGAVATPAVFCISGWWAAPSQATTDRDGGGSVTPASYPDPGAIVAQRKERMARDFVRFAGARILYAAQQG